MTIEFDSLNDRMAKLEVWQGHPVPWFVEWCEVDEGGKKVMRPDFRIMSMVKWSLAVTRDLCWVCGQRLWKYKTFVSGPLLALTRTSYEPPSHKDCSIWAARNCPYLSNPEAVRREDKTKIDSPGGLQVTGNTGIVLLWTTKRYNLLQGSDGSRVIDIGKPDNIEWWTRRRPAKRAEVEAAMATRIPIMENVVATELERKELRGILDWLPSIYPRQ